MHTLNVAPDQKPEPLFTAPVFLHDPPDGTGRFEMFAELQAKMVSLRETERELQDMLAKADDDPYAIGDDFRQRRLAVRL